MMRSLNRRPRLKLGNTAIGTLVNNIVAEKMMNYLEDHPAEAKIILDKSIASSNCARGSTKSKRTAKK